MKQKVKATPLVMLLVKDIRLLEHDPDAQYRFNRWCLLIFLWQMPLMILLVVYLPHFWLAIGVAYTAEISLWSLVATHLGNMISAISAHNAREAVKNTTSLVDNVSDTLDNASDAIDDIQDHVEVLPVIE